MTVPYSVHIYKMSGISHHSTTESVLYLRYYGLNPHLPGKKKNARESLKGQTIGIEVSNHQPSALETPSAGA